MHYTITFVGLFVIFSIINTSEAACCFDIRKVCERLSDVSDFGEEDWQSLVIVPGKCENNTHSLKRESIKRDTFAKVPQLKNVYIVDLDVEFVEEKPFDAIKDHLVYLSIIRNNISEIPVGCFQDLPKLKKLVLRDSEISTINTGTFKDLPQLEILLLSGNKLTKITGQTLNNINVKTLDLSFNKIANIERNAFPNSLILLNLKKNELKKIDDNTFMNLKSLEMLILSKNKLKKLRKSTFTGLSNLSKLDLSKNEIDTIEVGTFDNLHELMFLYLKYNRLHVLDSVIFKYLINLTDLELEHNNLTALSEDTFKSMPNLEEISIANNPWKCSNLENILGIIKRHQISISDSREHIHDCNNDL